MTTDVVVKSDTRICHMCWQHAGRSRWAVGVPVFGLLCKACWEPVKTAMLNPKGSRSTMLV